MIAAPAVEPSRWMPIGGALAASLILHALILGAIVALLVQPGAPSGARFEPAVLSAVLALAVETSPAPMPVEPQPPATDRPRPSPLAPPALPAPTGPVAPWSGADIDTSPLASMTGPPRVAAGVDIFEMRNIATLGEDIERRIQRGFADEADLPMQLRPVAAIGYPLDALAAGIEGRVLVWFGVDEEGKVVDREALDGPQELRDWVLERLDVLVEKPARTFHDRPVRSWAALEVTFNRESAEEARERLAAEAAAITGRVK